MTAPIAKRDLGAEQAGTYPSRVLEEQHGRGLRLIFTTLEILFFVDFRTASRRGNLSSGACAAAGVEPELQLTEVRSQADVERLRLLGSPSVRADGLGRRQRDG